MKLTVVIYRRIGGNRRMKTFDGWDTEDEVRKFLTSQYNLIYNKVHKIECDVPIDKIIS